MDDEDIAGLFGIFIGIAITFFVIWLFWITTTQWELTQSKIDFCEEHGMLRDHNSCFEIKKGVAIEHKLVEIDGKIYFRDVEE